MKKPFYKQLLINRVAVSFRAPFDDVWDLHQSTMAVEGTTHLHHFTGLVVKRWNFGLLHCVPKNGSEEAGNYSSNGTSGLGRPREKVPMKTIRATNILLVALGLGIPLCARAQSNWQPPKTVTRNAAGDYIVNTPEQPPTTIAPDGRGGYVANTPGQEPTVIVPNSDGGYTIEPQMQGAKHPLEFPEPKPPVFSLSDFEEVK